MAGQIFQLSNFFTGDLTHSEVIKSIPMEDTKTENLVEKILREIADLVPSARNTTKRVYQLKKSQEKFINPFFYFYTRLQKDEVDAEFTEKMELFTKPPCHENMPKLKPLFKGLPRLTRYKFRKFFIS